MKINVAIVGVGNCASSLVQGIFYYRENKTQIGLMHRNFADYKITDISIVNAFDVDFHKVGKDLSEAIFTNPNCTKKFSKVSKLGIIVKKGPVIDGVATHMANDFVIDHKQKPVDVVKELKKSNTEILICYLPVGSYKAARFYAQCAIDAGCGFINAMPEFICSDNKWIEKFRRKGLPCAGDDIKSQIGATIVHRMLARLIQDRGQTIDNSYQVNFGGNTDFKNMLDQARLANKRKSKTQAVTSILDKKIDNIKIGPSDYIPFLRDNKICYINIKGRQFGNIPFELDVKLSVEDSPNSAGVMIDVIRAMKVAMDRNMSGNLEAISAYAFKSPKVQYRDDEARLLVEDFIQGKK